MYFKPVRRSPAVQARHLNHDEKRQPQIQQSGGTGGGFTLTGPVTITQIVVASPTKAQTSQTNSLPAIQSPPTSSQPVVTAVPTPSVSLLSTSTQTTVPGTIGSFSSSNTMQTTQPSGQAMADSGKGKTNGAIQQTSGLPAGAVAGIVIGTLLLILGVVVVLVRRRLILNRQKRRATWKNGMFSRDISGEQYNRGGINVMQDPEKNNPPSGYTGEPMSPRSVFARQQAQIFGAIPTPTIPTTTYNNPRLTGYTVPTVKLSRTSSIGGQSASTAPLSLAPPLPVNGATVKCTFIPTLPDELSISMGDVVRVLAEYDDGWALCVNGRGEQGMVPLECLDQNNGSFGFMGNESRRTSGQTARRY